MEVRSAPANMRGRYRVGARPHRVVLDDDLRPAPVAVSSYGVGQISPDILALISTPYSDTPKNETEYANQSVSPNAAVSQTLHPQLNVVIDRTNYRVCNPWARHQNVCRNHLRRSCPFGTRCHRFHLYETHLPQEHVNIIRTQPETIRVCRNTFEAATAPPPPSIPIPTQTVEASATLLNQPVVKLPQLPRPLPTQHMRNDPPSNNATRITIPTLMSTATAPPLLAPPPSSRPVPLPSKASSTKAPPTPTPAQVKISDLSTGESQPKESLRLSPILHSIPQTRRQNTTARYPTLTTNNSTNDTKPCTDSPMKPPHQPSHTRTNNLTDVNVNAAPSCKAASRETKNHSKGALPPEEQIMPNQEKGLAPFSGGQLTFERFYAGIHVDLETGFWGWKAGNDSWDDTDSSNDSSTELASSRPSSDAGESDIDQSSAPQHRLLCRGPLAVDIGEGHRHVDTTGPVGDVRYCRQWIRAGRCAYGSSCKFLHIIPPSEPSCLQENSPSPPTTAPPTVTTTPIPVQSDEHCRLPPARTSGAHGRGSVGVTNEGHDRRGICYAWARGSCHLGDNCRYKHIVPPRLAPPSSDRPPPPTAATQPAVKDQDASITISAGQDGRSICRDWVNGDCRRGNNCMYTHLAPPGLAPRSSSSHHTTAGSTSSHRSSASAPTAPSTVTSLSSHRSSASTFLSGQTKTNTSTHTATNASSWNVRVLDHTKMLIGAGFVVEALTTGFETPWVLFEGIPSNVSTTLLSKALSDYGRVIDTRVAGKKHRVKFGNAKEAQDAISELNGAVLFDHKVSAKLYYSSTDLQSANGAFTDTGLWITWDAPGKIAYGGYNTEAQSKRAITAATSQGYHAVPHEGLPAVGFYTVRFMSVPADADKEWLSRFGPIDDAMWEEARYTDIDQAIRAIKSRLVMDGDVIDFELLPGQSHGMYRAIASFLSADQAKAACTRLHGWKPASLGKVRIAAYHRQQVCYAIPPTAYAKISDDIASLRQTIHERDGQRVKLSITHIAPPGLSEMPVKIRLSADDLKDLVQFKTEFERILRGEVVRENGRLMWDGFFASKQGSAFVRDLELTFKGVCIEVDNVRRAIVLWGSASKRDSVREKILDKAGVLRAAQIFSVEVPAEQLPGLCRSPDIHKLQDEIGHDNFWLELLSRRVMVRGDKSAYLLAKEAIRRTQERRLQARRNQPFNIAACPACFDEVTLPIDLPCGHAWCRECLSNYLLAAINGGSFPLTCFGDQGKCSQPIPLGIARECLSTHDFQALIRASYFSHVHSRPKEFFYCPTPDCQEIYRTAPKGTVLQCPACLQRICPYCHVEYHEGAPCPERDEDDKLFLSWMKDHDVKNCPGCRVPIERGEGCNHITCIRCQTHICWVCLETFPRGDGIYEHMRSMHGGIGLRADGL